MTPDDMDAEPKGPSGTEPGPDSAIEPDTGFEPDTPGSPASEADAPLLREAASDSADPFGIPRAHPAEADVRPASDEDNGGEDGSDDPAPEPADPDEKESRSFWRELPVLIVVALVVAVLIKTFLVQAFFIPSASMHDTLLEGDRVMVNKLAFRFGEPGTGDVIVFDSPLDQDEGGENFFGAILRNIGESLGVSTPDSALIKRVVAIEGETVEIRDGAVLIDGIPLDEPYLPSDIRMRDFGPMLVPEGEVFVMGDNRNQSEDSRRFGTVPESDIIGRAFVIVWPPSRWGGL